MDHVTIEKFQAMKKYKKNEFLSNLIFHFSAIVIFVLFCSSPIWFPYVYSSINVFLFVYLPNFKHFVFNPKCLFVVCNVIVVFLIGESKFVGSKSSPATDIYDEYVKRSASLKRHPIIVENKKVEELKLSDEVKEIYVDNKVSEENEEEVVLEGEMGEVEEGEEEKLIEEEVVEVVEEVEEVEEEVGLPAEELNQRVEDFIAKINKQRRLEATLLVCNSE